MFCKTHPTYKALRRPRTDCVDCRTAYENNDRKESRGSKVTVVAAGPVFKSLTNTTAPEIVCEPKICGELYGKVCSSCKDWVCAKHIVREGDKVICRGCNNSETRIERGF